MSRQLNMEIVLEKLQQVLHDLHDLSGFREEAKFQGIVITDLPFQYRDVGLSHWTVRIEPMPPPHPQPLTYVLQEVAPEGESDEAVRTGPEG